MKKKKKKITAGDCVEMYDFLAGKGIRLPADSTVQQTYETAKRHGYKEPVYFGKVGGGGGLRFSWLLVIVLAVLLFLGVAWLSH